MNALRKLALETLYALRKAGAEHADCTVKWSSMDESNALGKAEYLLREFDSCDIEITAEKGGKRASLTFNQTDPASIEQAAASCVAACVFGIPADKPLSYSGQMNPDRVLPIKRDPEKLYRQFEEFIETLKNEYPDVSTDADIRYWDNKVFYLNSDGAEYTNRYQTCSAGWQGNTRQDDNVTDFESFWVQLPDLDTPIIDCGVAKEKLDGLGNMLGARPIGKGGFVGTLVLTTEAFRWTFLPQINHRIENRKEGDGYPDPTCSPLISVYTVYSDKPFADGEPVENSPRVVKKYTIQNGKPVPDPEKELEGAELDAYRQKRLADMEGLNHQLLCMEPGETPLEEIIRNVKQGLLLGFIQGSMPSDDGDFSGAAKSSYYIEDGKIRFPVMGTMVCGNVFELMKQVSAVSKETKFEDGVVRFPLVAVEGANIL